MLRFKKIFWTFVGSLFLYSFGKAEVQSLTQNLTKDSPIELGTLSKNNPWLCRFRLESKDPEIATLARRALALHGGMIETTHQSNVEIKLEYVDPTLTVELNSKAPQLFYTTKLTGKNKSSLCLKACDVILEKIWKKPGFLAGSLAFISDVSGSSEIYLSDLLFQNVLQVTNDRSDVLSPRWHPKGHSLVYTTYFRSGFPDIYSMDLASKKAIPLATYKGTNSAACIGPDGNIAMVLSATQKPQIYLTDPKGKIYEQLTDSEGIKTLPTWSKDQKTLLFGWDSGSSKPQLYQLDVGRLNGKPTLPQRIPINLSGYIDEGDWHPFEKIILFTAAVKSGFQLGVFSFQNRESRFLTEGEGDHFEGKWLSDGRHVVCTERIKGKRTLILFDTQTKKRIPLPCSHLKNTYQADFLYLK